MAYLRSGPAVAFRIADSRYPLLSGFGAAHFGGRWNVRGHPVVYAAANLEGAHLEALAWANSRELPPTQVWCEIQVPGRALIEVIEEEDLPADWASDEEWSQQYGQRWYLERRSDLLLVPSAITGPPGQNFVIREDSVEKLGITHSNPQKVNWDPRLRNRL